MERDIKKLANNLMFDVNDEEIATIAKDFTHLDKMLAMFSQIDTENVEEMIYPFEVKTNFYREDTEGDVLSQQEALANAKKVISGHVFVPKVVK